MEETAMTSTTDHDHHLEVVVVDEKEGSKRTSISSQSKRPPAVEKSVLITGDSIDVDETDLWIWYRVSVDVFSSSSSLNNKRKRRVALSKSKDLPLLSPIWKSDPLSETCFAVIGSTIYSVGGAEEGIEPTSDVYVADMDMAASGGGLMRWEKISNSMLIRRRDAQAVAVDDKLYVFGGINPELDDYPLDQNNNISPWAEVFDPKQQLWTPLPQPPVTLPTFGLFAAYDSSSSSSYDDDDDDAAAKKKKKKKNKKMVVLGCIPAGLLLAYDVTGNSWEKIDNNFEAFYRLTRPVLYDNRLYWIYDQDGVGDGVGVGVAVYDLNLKKTSTGPIKVPHFERRDMFFSCFPPAFLHVEGDEFCCFWMYLTDYREGEDEEKEDEFPYYLCCSYMHISKNFDELGHISSVKGHLLSTLRYPVDHIMRYLTAFLLLGHYLVHWEKSG